MGTSADYSVAVEEGATIIRIGTELPVREITQRNSDMEWLYTFVLYLLQGMRLLPAERPSAYDFASGQRAEMALIASMSRY